MNKLWWMVVMDRFFFFPVQVDESEGLNMCFFVESFVSIS